MVKKRGFRCYLLAEWGIKGKKHMGTPGVIRFNEAMRRRTKAFAVNVFKMLNVNKTNDLGRIIFRQLIRCSSSVASNFRAAVRGRSEAEFYSKICIVVEECDESVFWLEYLAETDILNTPEVHPVRKEAEELLAIFSTIKKKLKDKRKM